MLKHTRTKNRSPLRTSVFFVAILPSRYWLLAMAVMFCCPWAKAEWVGDKQNIMGTQVQVGLWHPDVKQGRRAAEAVMEEMRRIDNTLSPYIESSDLAQLNARAAKNAQKISDELSYLIQRSLYYSKLSEGAFDITFASVGWHYDYRNQKKPNDEQRQKLLPAINYHWLNLDTEKKVLAFEHDNVRIDLGGIAKGYAVDRAIEILKEHGVKHATVSAGGDSKVLGDKLGKPWVVGIKNPRISPQNPKEVVLSLPLFDAAVSTSGDYERFFIDAKSGERVHHIINPKTGKSANELMSVTVIGENSIDCDALSTTVFVLGREQGLALINKIPQVDAVIIDRNGKVYYSDGLMEPSND